MNITLVSFTESGGYSQEEENELKKYVDDFYLCKLFWRNIAMNLSFKYPNNVRKYTRKTMAKLLSDIKEKKKFDIVIIDHLQMFEYAKLFPKSKIVLHTQNVESDVWKEYSSKCNVIIKPFGRFSRTAVWRSGSANWCREEKTPQGVKAF